jgi:hypothetical protein
MYRARRFEDAKRAREESNLLREGGLCESWTILAMTRHRLGEHESARQILAVLEEWMNTWSFASWQAKVGWQLVYEEARALILTMPRAAD